MDGFRKFILGGGLVPVAVAFVMGTAFAAVVGAFVNIIMDLVAKAGGAHLNANGWTPDGLRVGAFITAIVTFVIIGAVVYYFVVVPYTRAKERYFPDPEPGATTEDLLTQIRDLLATERR